MEEKLTDDWFCLEPGIKPESIFKLHIEFIEEEDGSGVIHIEWDDKDADLQWWTNLGEKKQQAFITHALELAIQRALNTEESDDGI